MIPFRRIRFTIAVFALAALSGGSADAQDLVDTIGLDLGEPDSIYVERRGRDVVIGWYAKPDSLSKVIGSLDYSSWYGEHGPGSGVHIDFTGFYSGPIDRSLIVEKFDTDAYEVGASRNFPLRISTIDRFNRTYEKIFNVGTDFYAPEDPIEVILGQIGLEPGETPDTLDLGFSMHFSAGLVDTSLLGQPANFRFDVQDFEGYHVWRGLSPYPSEMESIVELSKEDYFKVSNLTSIEDVPVKWRWLWEYFRDHIEEAWPRRDDQGRFYYEWIDENAYAGFTYYYNVTTFDRGYFKGFNLSNKVDNFVCDEDPDNPATPGQPVLCEDVVMDFTVSVDTGSDVSDVYVVPNPYRTGTSAETTPYYHNFPDMTLKFFNIPMEANIKIFTVAGDLVWEGYHNEPTGMDGIVSWDVKNKHGQDVGSGVYVYRVERTDGQDVYGRIVIIR